MTIRTAHVGDLAVLVRMGLRFIATSSYRGTIPASAEQLGTLVAWLLDQGGIFVAVDDEGDEPIGMLAATVIVHPMSGELVASEVAWWIEPEFRGGSAGLRLLAAAEAWARAQGATRFQMIAPAGSSVGALYRRRGYAELETTWQRPLEGESDAE